MTRILLLILLFSCNLVLADTIVIKEKEIVSEAYSDSVKVSGEFLVGMQFNTTDNLRSLHVQFPKDTTGTLCIELSSIDGKYKAKLEHEIREARSGLTKIEFPSRYPDIIPSYSTREVAILASLRKCNVHDKDSKWLVSSWSDKASSDLVLLIRSDARRDVARISNNDSLLKEAKCKKFRKTYNVSYDKYCLLEDVEIERINKIQVLRRNLQEISPEEFFIN